MNAKLSIILCVAVFFSVASAFRVGVQRQFVFRSTSLRMSDNDAEKSSEIENPVTPVTATPETPVTTPSSTESGLAVIPVDLDNMGTAVGVFGGVLGLILAGPVGGIVLASITKYVSKKENDSGEALRGLGKTIIESYNFLTKINGKYGLIDKATKTVDSAVSSAGVSDNEALDTVKKTVATTKSKYDEINKEYDIVAKGKQLLTAAGTLSDAALEKFEELNAKYDFVATAKSTTSTVAKKVTEKVKEQTNKE
mmetsp:Transcript_17555/g.17630  ORF Transcript_17555/g.17630 Transcript_17555/m.17630 type:complete len:253 (-) Transcript_17555:89-847(-)|eukprot:CAMPEP_0182417486 /NCGR_PEP_ID=MMETSP1167-20130531/1972_1 /TAXON_ID=2988 /ORGANISM="Mallomonas Sp, Strain CCMP3275" /LENGTH=252 /DNA_ID=CAMNT_0024591107 /DNA_START=66 /DNA_END=824 /DNA_ORIENTATION=+